MFTVSQNPKKKKCKHTFAVYSYIKAQSINTLTSSGNCTATCFLLTTLTLIDEKKTECSTHNAKSTGTNITKDVMLGRRSS